MNEPNHSREADEGNEPLRECTICRQEKHEAEVLHLRIYVTGSEGVDACEHCRILLSEFVRGLMRLRAIGYKQASKAMRKGF